MSLAAELEQNAEQAVKLGRAFIFDTRDQSEYGPAQHEPRVAMAAISIGLAIFSAALVRAGDERPASRSRRRSQRGPLNNLDSTGDADIDSSRLRNIRRCDTLDSIVAPPRLRRARLALEDLATGGCGECFPEKCEALYCRWASLYPETVDYSPKSPGDTKHGVGDCDPNQLERIQGSPLRPKEIEQQTIHIRLADLPWVFRTLATDSRRKASRIPGIWTLPSFPFDF
jgi:hypothetical protein